MTVAAPMSLATAAAWMPSPPAPWMTTVLPKLRPARARPKITWESAQLTGATSSSGHAARHLVAVDPALLRQPQRRVAPPEVEIRAADVGERDADEDRVGLHVRHGDVADLEGLAGTEEDRRLAAAHRLAPLATSNASCRVRTASSAYLSSMTHETAISDVEIIWMLMPSRPSAANIVEATPEWLRMPTPTMETLATRSSCTIPRAPISRTTSERSATARA